MQINNRKKKKAVFRDKKKQGGCQNKGNNNLGVQPKNSCSFVILSFSLSFFFFHSQKCLYPIHNKEIQLSFHQIQHQGLASTQT